MMTSESWTRPSRRGVRSSYDDVSPHRNSSRHRHRHHHHRLDDSPHYVRPAAVVGAPDYELYSPKSSRRKIAEIEQRLTDLRASSETMTRQLGRVERSLLDLDIDRAQPRRSRSRPDLVRFSDDTDECCSSSSDDDDVIRTSARRHGKRSTLPFGGDREALRREIAQLHADLRALRRQTSRYDDVTDCRRRDVSTGCRDVIEGDLTQWGSGHHMHRSATDDDIYTNRRHHEYGRDAQPTCCSGLVDTATCRHQLPTTTPGTTTHNHPSSCYYRDALVAGPGRRVVSATCCSGTGLRSVLRQPITTQHNKALLSSPTHCHRRSLYDPFDTANKTSFKPASPTDVTFDDVVKFRRSGGRMELGRVLYVGHLPGKNGPYLGVELENATGNHDGLHNGFRYFQCKPNRGLFVKFDHVMMAWRNYY